MTTLRKVVCFVCLIILTLAHGTNTSLVQESVRTDDEECKDFGRCSQICVHSVKCSCISGFKLSNNNSCVLLDDNATIVFAGYGGIRAFPFWNPKKRYKIPGSSAHITYNSRENFLYWTEIYYRRSVYDKSYFYPIGSIWRSRLDGSEKKIVVDKGVPNPQAIAYDWIGGNLYFADRDYIAVCSADFLFCSILMKVKSKIPTELALHPNQGLIFWDQDPSGDYVNNYENIGVEAGIMRAGMDGSNSVQITQNHKTNGMSVDIGNSRIYWTDMHKHLIESARLDGSDRRIIISKGLEDPWGIAVIGDTLVWSDPKTSVIEASNKFNSSQRITLLNASLKYDYYDPSLHKKVYICGLVIFHEANQPISRNPCKDAGCSHFCVIGPDNSFRCMCPIGMDLISTNKMICSLVKIHQCSSESGINRSCGFSDNDLRGTSVSRCPGNQVLDGKVGTCVCPEARQVFDKSHRNCVLTPTPTPAPTAPAPAPTAPTPAPAGYNFAVIVGVILFIINALVCVIMSALTIRKYKKRTNLEAQVTEPGPVSLVGL